jgi:hypothetical protein
MLHHIKSAALAAHKAASNREPSEQEVDRIVVNFLRHTLTKYDMHMDGLTEVKARMQTKKSLLLGIGKVFPELQDEVERQSTKIH